MDLFRHCVTADVLAPKVVGRVVFVARSMDRSCSGETVELVEVASLVCIGSESASDVASVREGRSGSSNMVGWSGESPPAGMGNSSMDALVSATLD